MLVYGKYECFVMQVCVLCASCGSPQCYVLHDLQFVNAGRGCKRRPYGRGSKQHSLQSVELSCRLQTAVQIVSKPSAPSNGEPIYRCLGKPAMRTCSSQKRMMLRQIPV